MWPLSTKEFWLRESVQMAPPPLLLENILLKLVFARLLDFFGKKQISDPENHSQTRKLFMSKHNWAMVNIP